MVDYEDSFPPDAAVRSVVFVIAAVDSINQDADYVCNGTNDEVTIQAAIDALPSGAVNEAGGGADIARGKIVCLEGNFQLDDRTLINRDHIDFGGVGPGTIFHCNHPANYGIVVGSYPDIWGGVHLHDFSMEGGSGTTNPCLKLNNSIRNTYARIKIHYGGPGIYVNGNSDRFKDILLTSCYPGMIVRGHDMAFQHMSVLSCGNGIEWQTGQGGKIRDSVIEGCENNGILVQKLGGDGAGPNTLIIEGVHFELNNSSLSATTRDINVSDNTAAYISINDCLFTGTKVDYCVYSAAPYTHVKDGRSYNKGISLQAYGCKVEGELAYDPKPALHYSVAIDGTRHLLSHVRKTTDDLAAVMPYVTPADVVIPFEEGQGTSFDADISGNSEHAALTGSPSHTTIGRLRGLAIDAGTKYGTVDPVTLNGARTIIHVFKPSFNYDALTAWRYLSHLYFNTANYIGIYYDSTANRQWKVRVDAGGAGPVEAISQVQNFSSGDTIVLVATIDSSGRIRLYLNGEFQHTALQAGAMSASAGTWTLGGANDHNVANYLPCHFGFTSYLSRQMSDNEVYEVSKELGLVVGQDYTRFDGAKKTIATADATVTTLMNHVLTDEKVYHIRASVLGRERDGSDRNMYHIEGLFYRTGAGNAVQQGATTSLTTAESEALCNCNFDVSGHSVRVRVTGVAAEDWDWQGILEVHEVGSLV